MPNGPLKTVGEHTVTRGAAHRRGGRRQGRGARRDRPESTSAARADRGRLSPAPSLWASGCFASLCFLHRMSPRSSPGLSTRRRDAGDYAFPDVRRLPVARALRAVRAADDEVARLRVPPHSIEAEQSVLGGLLLDNGAWDRVGDLLTDSDFYRYEHRLIYAAIGGAGQRHQAGRRDHRVRAAAEPRQGRGVRRPGLPERAGAERAERGQHPPLRRDRARALDPAQAGRGQRRDRHHRLQPAGPAGRRRSSTRPRARSSTSARKARRTQPGLPEHGPAGGAADRPRQRAARERRRGRDRRAHRLLRPRPHDLRPAGRRPDRAGGAARRWARPRLALNIAEHVAVQRRPAGGRVLDGNGRLAARAADGRLARPHRPEPPAHRQRCATTNGARLSEAVEKLGKVSLLHRRDAGRSTPASCAPARAARRASAASSA